MPDVEDAEDAAEAGEAKKVLKEEWDKSQSRDDDNKDDTSVG